MRASHAKPGEEQKWIGGQKTVTRAFSGWRGQADREERRGERHIWTSYLSSATQGVEQRSGELPDGEKATEVFLFVLFVFGKERDIATGFLC